ncbi:DotU/TssL family secretion system protein [Jeongeupia wiesaeckerbachi]|uniref:DotU/TssL family secretion system protein n=1 Tax=Jeongeupia wiesaeckerbachi TaxID=3051218 RepID=UPI003D804366
MRDVLRASAALHRDAPLTPVFESSWGEWLERWQEIRMRTQPGEALAAEAVEVASTLARRLARVALSRTGHAGQQQVDAMQFAFVALIDESLIFDEWAGQESWQAAPLELRLFGTCTAGEQVPAQIEQLLHARDPATRDLANVLLQVLLLGFYGRLRSGEGRATHAVWRRALFEFAWGRAPDEQQLAADLERPAAVTPLRVAARRMLPDGARLGLIGLALVALMIVIGHLFWMDLSTTIEAGLPLTAEVKPS